jgi:phospholipid/cholesterol/gamma-HCH transport system substrate-binding protein
MSGQADKFKIGLFLVLSALIAIASLIWLGASRFLSPSQNVVAYFSESVQGLEQDSPVKFRGVNVGRVSRIRMAPDAKHIEILMSLDKSFTLSEDLGVRADLLGLTGQKYLEMDRFAPEQKRPATTLDFTPKYPVVAAYPSELRQFGNALDSLFQKVGAVDMERISSHLLTVSAKLDKILADSRVDRMGGDAAETLAELRESARRINQEIERIQAARRVGKILDNASDFFKEITQTVRTADQMIRRTDNNISRLSQKLERSADNLNELTTIVKNKPSLLLYGSSEKEDGKKR